MKKILALDIGASSGRALVGHFDGDKLSLEETARFYNGGIMLGDTLYWDFLRLFSEVKDAIRKTCHDCGGIASIGIDTWGVDFGLLDARGYLMENPVHYRDKRNDNMFEETWKILPRDELYRRTGIQMMDFNTLNQLYSLRLYRPEMLERARDMLFIPDLLNYYLCGAQYADYGVASTGQMLNPHTGDWDKDLLSMFGIPTGILPPVCGAGVRIGGLTGAMCAELGTPPVEMVTAGHDTAAAVAAVPSVGKGNYCYISSGTWSLLGVESDRPIITDKSELHDFTNEGGFDGKIRFLKNICGLWLIQESRRQWLSEGRELSFGDIDRLMETAEPHKFFIDPDDEIFSAPGDIPGRIAEYCMKTGQGAPQTVGETARCIIDSLALKYRYVIERLEDITGIACDTIHIVGGGSKNTLLCRYAADASGRTVIAGPAEATAMGTMAAQLMAFGDVSSLAQARECILRSCPPDTYIPSDRAAWDDAYDKFIKINGI